MGAIRSSALHQRLDPFQCVRQLITGDLRVVRGLRTQPIPRTEPQHTTEAQIGVGRDCPLAADDLADAGGGHVDGLGQADLTDAQGFEELSLKQFTGGDGSEAVHGAGSAVVDDLHVFRAAGTPAKAEPELVIDADAVLPSTISPQQFETVAGRHAQILQPLGDLQLPQLAPRHPLERLEARHLPTLGQCFGVGASERLDHAPSWFRHAE